MSSEDYGSAPAAEVLAPPIFIVEPDADCAAIIKGIVEEEGCTPYMFAGTRNLLEQVRHIRPFVMFLSTTLSGTNALAFCKLVRAERVAVVVMGQFRSPDQIILARKMGAIDFLVKPFDARRATPKIIDALVYAKTVLNRQRKFAELFPASSVTTPAFKARKVVEHAMEVMALPQSAARIIDLCGNPACDAGQLAAATEIDPGVSATLLKRANSAAYGFGTRVNSLQSAIVRLGNRMVRSIVTLMSVFKLSESAGAMAFDRLRLWVHCLGVGVIADNLAQQAGFGNPEDVLLAGVLHDFGKLMFADYLHADYNAVYRMAHDKHQFIYQAEQDYFDTSHDLLGREIALRWRLPEDICEAIGRHHDLRESTDDEADRPLTMGTIVNKADAIAKALFVGDSGDTCSFPLCEVKWDQFGMKDKALRPFVHKVLDEVVDFVNCLNITVEKSGIAPARPFRNKWVYVQDGGSADKLLDLFFAKEGYDTFRSIEEADRFTPPDVVLHDLRGRLTLTRPVEKRLARPGIRHIVIKGHHKTQTRFFPADAVVLGPPLDFVALLEAVERNGD
ncbi:MAG: HDOD domain-containing protein [Kiritimatiellae bacterium]|nr:HDOD domain-containing protein [Kiritimatiellia bacterium]